jgi:hypothetical protein
MQNLHVSNKNNKIKTKIIIRLLLFLFFLIFPIYIFYNFNPSREIYYFLDIHRGNKLIHEIEEYKERFSAYPKNLNFTNLDFTKGEDPRFFYELIDENRFVIWFGTILGESILYDSQTNEWAWISG